MVPPAFSLSPLWPFPALVLYDLSSWSVAPQPLQKPSVDPYCSQSKTLCWANKDLSSSPPPPHSLSSAAAGGAPLIYPWNTFCLECPSLPLMLRLAKPSIPLHPAETCICEALPRFPRYEIGHHHCSVRLVHSSATAPFGPRGFTCASVLSPGGESPVCIRVFRLGIHSGLLLYSVYLQAWTQ